MSSSVDATDLALRTSLDQLSSVMRRLHKALIDIEVTHFGPVSGPLQLLDLVTNHPHFAWLLKMSGLMAELDELRDSDEAIHSDVVAAFRAMIETLIGPRVSTHPEFRGRYLEMLQQSPEVAMAHGQLRLVLETLPDLPAKQPDA